MCFSKPKPEWAKAEAFQVAAISETNKKLEKLWKAEHFGNVVSNGKSMVMWFDYKNICLDFKNIMHSGPNLLLNTLPAMDKI